MNKDKPSNDEEALDRLLRSWTVDVAMPLGYRDEVWRRIARAEANPTWKAVLRFENFVNRLSHWFARPVGAAAYLSALLAIGTVLGAVKSNKYARNVETTWRTSYVRAVTPAPTPALPPP